MDFLDNLKLISAIAMLILVVVAAIQQKRDNKKSSGSWEDVAQKTGLRFFDRGAEDQELRGEYRGYRTRVKVRTEREQQGRYSETVFYTTVEVDTREETVKEVFLRLRNEEEKPKILRKQKNQSFGTRFLVTTDSQSQHIFQPDELRTAFLAMASAGDIVRLRGGRLKRERRALFVETHDLIQFLRSTTDLMERLDIGARQLEEEVHEQEQQEVSATGLW